MEELTNAIKLAVAKRKLKAYSQKDYDLSLELEIAMEVNNEGLQAKIMMQKFDLKKGVDFLKKKIKELEKEVKDLVVENK